MKGIIFTENIDMIMAGTKTQTRRVIKLKYSNTVLEIFSNKYGTRLVEIEKDTPPERLPDGKMRHKIRAAVEVDPKYDKGDIVYVKEAFATSYKDQFGMTQLSDKILYKADGGYTHINWRSPMLMPATAARTRLIITDVRAQRLQEITDADAYAEGMDSPSYPTIQYHDLWDKLNGKKNGGAYSWDANPWVYAYTFRRYEK